ncbi:histone acetyltransferase type B catalytic subunit [Parastagonospora nodorum]|nr:histone acetyltransferase type B catalytic subunit [Parastagonospora nodorum]KAH4269678.1 histone acetyltransferase type B catalytic subunit [Parastagonospora nodorum]KAH5242961.1 histone acetyltransferase type B catalytic subunit [Parastagonospora nodorum]KAH5306024.1 histone acetyltransferase type B catalytic subunit [Parastagonospora nodorum]KAH6499709.1 histone acetyltransferase type B catalytic subunit [Parastagonospora nodorum]
MDLDDWVTNSNECFFLNLYRPGTDSKQPRVFDDSFNPSFTYAVIDENETITGYKNPKIELDFRANDLKPRLKIQYDEKLELKDVPDITQVDLSPELFREHLPEPIPDDANVTSKDWKPPGVLMNSFSVEGKQYEIWKTPLADETARRIWKNMRILVLLFIEGATTEGLDDEETLDRWSLYLLYDVTPLPKATTTPYTLAGFSTSYRCWIFPTFDIMRATKQLPSPPPEASAEPQKYTPPRLTQDPETFLFNEKLDRLETSSRERISQFLILPPYQGQSLGAHLYDIIFEDLVKKPFIYEIPVEDPSEAFDAMRDYSDIVYLRKLSAFQSLSVASNLPPESLRKDSPIPRNQILGNGTDLEKLRHETKIVSRQFYRMVELHLLSTIPSSNRNRARITRKAKSSNENDRKYYFWRLALKHRIYGQNADALDQMEVSEKVEKLEAAVDNQQEEYEERLEGLEKRAEFAAGQGSSAGPRTVPKRKRAIVDEEDEEWEDMDDASVASSKRMKS